MNTYKVKWKTHSVNQSWQLREKQFDSLEDAKTFKKWLEDVGIEVTWLYKLELTQVLKEIEI